MTWHLGGRLGVGIVGIAAWLATGCGSSGQSAKFELTAPEKGAQLTLKTDDLDPDLNGLQYDVKATSSGVATGTAVLLTIEGVSEASFATVAKDGSILFDNVSLPPGKHNIQVRTPSGNVRSADDYDYTYKALIIDSPKDGSALGIADDKDSFAEGIQINVTVSAFAVEPSDEIKLQLDGTDIGKTAFANATTNKAVFTGVTLPTGSHSLKAVSGSVESNEVRVSINEGCASVQFVKPEAPSDGSALTLGGGNMCPAETEDFSIEVVVSTDAGENRDVELRVNGQTVDTTKVKGSLAQFDNVVLNHYTTANQLAVVVQGAQGVTCKEVPFPVDVFLDCDGPDCSIVSPDARPGPDASGESVLYLNKSALVGTGFDVTVHSDSGSVGKETQLIVDRQDRGALKATAEEVDDGAEAVFTTVKLGEGAHTIEARCQDAAGNVRYSGELNWVVDTKACTVDLSKPEANTLFTTEDDVDPNTNGSQVDVEAGVEGDDCSRYRAAPCDPEEGIVSAGFESWDGNSTLLTQVTLGSAADQKVCVEVEDRAGNVARDSVAVQYRTETPRVQIEEPADGSKYNVAGGTGYTADSDPSSATTCNANFRVLCSEVGSEVELHHGSPTGDVFATANCEEASGLPEGFGGRAAFDNVAFLVPGSSMTTAVATQSVSGSSQDALVGMAAVDLEGVCQPPSLSKASFCPPEAVELPMSGNYTVATMLALYTGVASVAPTTGTLTVTGSSNGAEISGSPYTSNFNASAHEFRLTNVNYGNVQQTITAVFTTRDAFDNVGTIECETELVSDLPTLDVTAPTENQTIGASQGCATGNSSQPFGVPFTASIDQTNQRSLSYTIGSGSAVNVPIMSSTTLNFCVPLPEGMSEVKVTLASTRTGGGTTEVTRHVTVKTLTITQPAATPGGVTQLQQGNITDDCDQSSTTFSARIHAQTDVAYDGRIVTVSSSPSNSIQVQVGGTGGIDACLLLPQGESTITLAIQGTAATASVTVGVVIDAPANPIANLQVTLPSGGNFRTGDVALAWDTPMQEWSTQLQSYQLRCAQSALDGSATSGDKNTWWALARTVTLPSSLKPPSNSVNTDRIRPGEALNCLLRAADAANNLTPMTGGSTAINFAFRSHTVEPSSTELAQMGVAVAPIGDVNGDGHPDVLIGSGGISGGDGRAYVYFGAATPAELSANPGVVIQGGPSGFPGAEFATHIAGIGDFNGDSRPDFAIGYPGFGGDAIDFGGALYIFYGRSSGDAWPGTIDVTTTCNADVCVYGQDLFGVFGWAVSPAGYFNSDDTLPDIAVSANGFDTDRGRVYVLLGSAYEGTGATRPNNFGFGIVKRVSDADLLGFTVDGDGGAGPIVYLGQAMAPVGNVDGTAGDDLILSSTGNGASMPAVQAQVFSLAGRAHSGSGLNAIPTSDLALLDSGDPANFALNLIPLRNFMDGGTNANNSSDTDLPDFAAYPGGGPNSFYVYLGDRNSNTSGVRFANNSRTQVIGDSNTLFGTTVSATFNPNLSAAGSGFASSLGDLDLDGLDDLGAGSGSGANAMGAGAAFLFYSDIATKNAKESTQLYTNAGSHIEPTAQPDVTRRVVQYVGDLSGDNEPDLIVADPDANGGRGALTILY